jgi:WD40 repeat protein
VRVWDLATGAPIGQPLTGHRNFVQSVATAQLNGRPVIVSGSYDGSIRVWDLARRVGS